MRCKDTNHKVKSTFFLKLVIDTDNCYKKMFLQRQNSQKRNERYNIKIYNRDSSIHYLGVRTRGVSVSI